MTITGQNSVFIIGAGVSKPFGIPLGGEMLRDIFKALTSELRALSEASSKWPGDDIKLLTAAATASAQFNRLPYCGAIARAFMADMNRHDAINTTLEMTKRFHGLLNNQTSETIDDFIAENPTFARLAKVAIATRLFVGCYFISEGNCSLRPLDARELPQDDDDSVTERNWIHLFINIIRHGIRNNEVSTANKVKVVTFNYDRILEHVLEKQFGNTESNYGSYSDFIDIHHVHGACGPLVLRVSDPQDTIKRWASGIHVVNETTASSEVEAARSAAKAEIKDASEIYAAGFSFAGPNRRLLGLEGLTSGLRDKPVYRTLYLCNFDGNIGISRSAQRCLRGSDTNVVEDKGARANGLSVVDWIRSGSLGELPG